jgi:hypothetical protein
MSYSIEHRVRRRMNVYGMMQDILASVTYYHCNHTITVAVGRAQYPDLIKMFNVMKRLRLIVRHYYLNTMQYKPIN